MNTNPADKISGKSLWILYPTALIPGMVLVLPGCVLSAVMDAFGLDKPRAGYMCSAYFAGLLIGMLALSDLVRKWGARKVLIITSLGASIALSGMSMASSYRLVLCLYVFMGLFLGVIITLPGVVISAVKGDESGGPMNKVYAMFSLAVLATPLAVGWLLKIGWPWWGPFFLPVGPAILVAFCACRFGLPPMKTPAGLSLNAFKRLGIKRGLFIGGMVCVLLYVASETAVVFWAPRYISEKFPMQVDIARASRLLTWFWAGMTFGRIVSAAILKRIDQAIFLVVLAAGSALTTAIAPHLNSAALMESAFLLTGVFYSGIYPTTMSYSGKLEPELAPIAFSLMNAMGPVGAIFLTPLVGHAAVYIPFSWAMSLVAAPLAAFAALVAIFKIRKIF